MEFGAGKEARTPDLDLGKVALYQLSYSRFEGRYFIDTARTVKGKLQPFLIFRIQAWPGRF